MSDDIRQIDNFSESTRNFIECPVLSATCPICKQKALFDQIYCVETSTIKGDMFPIRCHGCNSIAVFAVAERKIYPTQSLQGLEGLPEEIDKYYQEALRCIEANSPNGAVTLFRKTIHAIGIHYNIAKKHDKSDLKGIIEKLEDGGHITSKIKDRLLGIKDIGNDGAHINENEPDMEQALLLKGLLESVLMLTILDDQNVITVKNLHKSSK